MNPRLWLVRGQLLRAIGDAPSPTSGWSSVARRTLVMVGFFVIGLVTHDLATWVLCCFGAFQVGLVDVAVPLRRLVVMLVSITVASSAAVLLAMCLGGTWWSVVLVVVLAYAFGSSDRFGPLAGPPAIAALALGVIFCGMPKTPADALTATGWVALGCAVQALAWLLVWRRERRLFVRRAVALKLRTTARLLRWSRVEPIDLTVTHAESVRMHAALADAGLTGPDGAALERCAAEAQSAGRFAGAWMLLRQPGEEDRLAVALRLRRAARMLDDTLARRSEPWPAPGDRSTASGREMAERLDRVDAAVAAVLHPDAIAAAAEPEPDRVDEARREGVRAVLELVRTPSEHGLRMAVGVGLAQVLALLLPFGHSFWLPLTVVFTLKPDWSFTLLRVVTRMIGNTTAVILLPALMLATGTAGWRLALASAVLSAVAFRWFYGNYVWASFGVAGTVLILDYTLHPDPGLFAARIVATLLGGVITLVVASVRPRHSSDDGAGRAAEVIADLGRWADDVRATIAGAPVPPEQLESELMAARRSLVALEPVVSTSILEVRPQVDPAALSLVYAAGAEVNECLLALTACTALGVRTDDADPTGEGSALALELDRLTRLEADLARANDLVRPG